ncbi:ABC transporter permease [Teredinibacter turnerae]|uniref:ABC transporter permease n=1 Tax=Teredinibacter turnerae TaxID=2426 RepID=UPI0003756010|nr:ABC transporter permease [Teredinibacter turnerae]
MKSLKRAIIAGLFLLVGMLIFLVTFSIFNTIAFKSSGSAFVSSVVIIEPSNALLEDNKYESVSALVTEFAGEAGTDIPIASYIRRGKARFRYNGEEFVAISLHVTERFFEVMGVKPLFGSVASTKRQSSNSHSGVIVSYEVWQETLAGREEVVGTYLLSGEEEYEIYGVMPEGFGFPVNTGIWMLTEGSVIQNDSSYTVEQLAFVSPVNYEKGGFQLEKFVNERAMQVYPEWDKATPPLVINSIKRSFLKDGMHVYAAMIVFSFLFFLSSSLSALLVNIQGSINSKYLPARSQAEGLVTVMFATIAAAILSVIIVAGEQETLNSIVQQKPFWFNFAMDIEGVIVACLLFCMAWCISFLPLALISKRRQSSNYKSPATKEFLRAPVKWIKRIWVFNAGLLTGLTIISALLFVSNLLSINTDYGVRTDSIYIAEYNTLSNVNSSGLGIEGTNYFEVLKNGAEKFKGIASVAQGSDIPGSHEYDERIFMYKNNKNEDGEIVYGAGMLVSISDNYLNTLGVELNQGREPARADINSDEMEAVVTESFVDRFWPNETPLGKRLQLDTPSVHLFLKVVGVIPHLVMAPPLTEQRNYGSVFVNNYADESKGKSSIFVRIEDLDSKSGYELIHEFVNASELTLSVVDVVSLESKIAMSNAAMSYITSRYSMITMLSLLMACCLSVYVLNDVLLWKRQTIGREEVLSRFWWLKPFTFTVFKVIGIGIVIGVVLILVLEGGSID